MLYNPANEYYSAIAARQNDFQFTLTLPQEQFEKANDLITKEVERTGVPQDYYLRDFDDAQLREILVNVYEWSRQDIAAAAILLRERNVTVYSNQLQGQKEAKRLAIKKKEGRLSLPVLLIMYTTALLGGFATLVGGAFVYFATSVNPEGIRDYTFIQDYRIHGLAIMVISGVMIAAYFSLTFFGIDPTCHAYFLHLMNYCEYKKRLPKKAASFHL